MRKTFYLGAIASLSALITACSTPHKPTIHELFQVPQDTQFYTASTLWYSEPDEMTSLNFHKGKQVQYGAEVDEIDFNDQEVTFRVESTGQEHTITLDKDFSMLTMDEYLRTILTVQNPVENELEMDPVVYEKIRRGIVEPGMTKEQVIMAYGYPSKHRTASPLLNTWIYEEDQMSTKRVVFRNGKVLRVLKK